MQTSSIVFFYHAIIAYSETGHPDILDIIKFVIMNSHEKDRMEQLNKVVELKLTINKSFSQHSNPNQEYIEHNNQMNVRLSKIEDYLKKNEWSDSKVASLKEVLKEKGPDYLDALNKKDSMFFVNKYPNIFK